jgi:hypothetical protein
VDETYVISSGFDLCIKPMLVFVPERRITDQQDVQDHTWHTESEGMRMGVQRAERRED